MLSWNLLAQGKKIFVAGSKIYVHLCERIKASYFGFRFQKKVFIIGAKSFIDEGNHIFHYFVAAEVLCIMLI
jgi:hypothetical protein